MNREQENNAIKVYLTLYIIGLILYYYDITIIASILFTIVGVMIYNHIKIVFYMFQRQNNG